MEVRLPPLNHIILIIYQLAITHSTTVLNLASKDCHIVLNTLSRIEMLHIDPALLYSQMERDVPLM